MTKKTILGLTFAAALAIGVGYAGFQAMASPDVKLTYYTVEKRREPHQGRGTAGGHTRWKKATRSGTLPRNTVRRVKTSGRRSTTSARRTSSTRTLA